jgi:hypothetical protein
MKLMRRRSREREHKKKKKRDNYVNKWKHFFLRRTTLRGDQSCLFGMCALYVQLRSYPVHLPETDLIKWNQSCISIKRFLSFSPHSITRYLLMILKNLFMALQTPFIEPLILDEHFNRFLPRKRSVVHASHKPMYNP